MSAETHLPPFWEKRVLVVLGAPAAAREPVRFLAAQAKAEGGSAHWNPTNTTLPLPGSWLYNSAGVRNYRRPVDGICAVAMTIANGYYPHLFAWLQHPGAVTAEQAAGRFSGEIKKWGTSPALIEQILRSTP